MLFYFLIIFSSNLIDWCDTEDWCNDAENSAPSQE